MVFDFEYSRIFIVSENDSLSQKISSVFPQDLELDQFNDWRTAFQNMYHQPDMVFFELVGKMISGNSFLEKMLDFNKDIPIILIKNNNNITCKNLLEKENVVGCFEIEELNKTMLYYFLKHIKLNSKLNSRIKKLEDQLELKSSLEEELVLENKNATNNFFAQEITFEEYKHQIIHHYLEKYDGDIMLVSNKLDIGKSTIYGSIYYKKEIS